MEGVVRNRYPWPSRLTLGGSAPPVTLTVPRYTQHTRLRAARPDRGIRTHISFMD